MNKKKYIVVVFCGIAVLVIVGILLMNVKYVKFVIEADFEKKPLKELSIGYYGKHAVGYETQHGWPYLRDDENRALVFERKIDDENGSIYSYPVVFLVDGKKVCGFFQFENLQEGIHDSWNNDVYVHFFYEDGMLNEKITCTDGEVVKKINDKNSDDFDVTIRK